MLIFGLLHRMVNTLKKIHAKRVCATTSSCFFTQLNGVFRRLIARLYVDNAGCSKLPSLRQGAPTCLKARIKFRLFLFILFVKHQAGQMGAIVFGWHALVSRFGVANHIDSRRWIQLS